MLVLLVLEEEEEAEPPPSGGASGSIGVSARASGPACFLGVLAAVLHTLAEAWAKYGCAVCGV